MSKIVREPIQVYLSPSEREELDAASRDMGVSRSEALRRGIRALHDQGSPGPLRDLSDHGYVTGPLTGPGGPPPSAPVTTLAPLLAGLDEDRRER